MSFCGPRVETHYLGYPLTITERDVFVRTPQGRKLGVVSSVKQARLLVRGYRKAARTAT